MLFKKKLNRYSMELDDRLYPVCEMENVRSGMRKYSIPVDSDGFVPTWAIVSRYHQKCGTKERFEDLKSDDNVLPPRLTPKEIIDWWADPTLYDICGIDTMGSNIYDVSSVKGKRMKEIQSRIAVICPSKSESDKIRQTISESFTLQELDEMTSGVSLIIQTVPDMKSANGVYVRRQPGMNVPIVVYESPSSPDVIVHELVHHLRTMPSRDNTGITESQYPMNKDRSVNYAKYISKSSKTRERIEAVEESATVVETVLRTSPDSPSGYYNDVPSTKSIDRLYMEDQILLKDDPNKIITGKKAVKRVNLDYDKTNIAAAEILSRESAKVSAKKLYSGKK